MFFFEITLIFFFEGVVTDVGVNPDLAPFYEEFSTEFY